MFVFNAYLHPCIQQYTEFTYLNLLVDDAFLIVSFPAGRGANFC